MDGADTCHSQLYKLISAHPFKEAGIKGFTPPSPFKVPANFIDIGDFKEFRWLTLAELIDNIKPFPWHDNEERRMVMSDNNPISPPIMYNGPPQSLPLASKPEPSTPTITTLALLIILSTNNCSSLHTRSERLIVMNGVWFVLHSRIPFCCTRRVCRTDAFLSNSIWLTQRTHVTMPSINVIGYNIVIATLPCLVRWTHT